MRLEMKRQDLEELYLLLEVYERTYGGRVVSEIKKELTARHRGATGENISGKRNPRGAGRKSQYTEEEKQRIRELRDRGMTIRGIAEGTGCSVGYVQGVLSDPLKRGVQ